MVSLRWGIFEKHQIAGISRKSSENFFIFCSQSEKLSVREEKKATDLQRGESQEEKRQVFRHRILDLKRTKRKDVEEVCREWKQASEKKTQSVYLEKRLRTKSKSKRKRKIRHR